jgi:anti-sigma factor RsiW
MNKCTELNLQEMLPDLLHRKLEAQDRARVEAHVAECAPCAEELRVLRTVASASVFAPAIDVDKIVRQILPYRELGPIPQPPVARAPARSRVVSWLVAASMLVVLAGGGSLLMQQRPAPTRVASAAAPVERAATPRAATPVSAPEANPTNVTRASTVAVSGQPTHALALAAGVDGLSDNDLRQLMNDMDSFDALPTTEPEPVISVDGGDTSDSGL